MFKNILIATDGSKLSRKAIVAGVKLAKACGAKVTGFFSPEEFRYLVYGEYIPPDLLSEKEWDKRAADTAKKYLAEIEKAAFSAGVICSTTFEKSGAPWEAIVAAAKKHKCDLIVLASHGHSGLGALVLGSQTTKVLTHTKIPVLVCR
jgi:nucleotide-binding universal stress UspA family protein